MSNIQIESDLKEILTRIDNKLDKLNEDVTELKVGQAKIEGDITTIDERLSGQIKSSDERLSGQIKSSDERLSGQIKSLDERLSGQIKSLDTKVEQLDKRCGLLKLLGFRN